MSASAFRAVVDGAVQGVGFRQATVARARELGVLGWVRNADDGTVVVHAEGRDDAVAALRAFLGEGPRGARVDRVTVEDVGVEGHEQFAVRGVPHGAFLVREQPHGFAFVLEVDGVPRVWTLPKAPAMDPSVKRFAVATDAPPAEGATWDGGPYEQGGRVAWPEAIERGHAVFVLHGQRLRGGWVLQRTRGANWLLLKRRDATGA